MSLLPNDFQKNYMFKYTNVTSFHLVYYKNMISCQNWVYLLGLENKKNYGNSNTQFNEYFLDEGPIKVVYSEGKYWIVDGHHRYFRGIMNGYKYFLVEQNNFYRPPCDDIPKQIDVFITRPKNDYDVKDYIKVPKYNGIYFSLFNDFKNVYNIVFPDNKVVFNTYFQKNSKI